MPHFCNHCNRDVPADCVSPRGKHDADQGGCGNDVRLLPPSYTPPTWWQQHGLSVGLALVGVGLALVILYNAGVWGG